MLTARYVPELFRIICKVRDPRTIRADPTDPVPGYTLVTVSESLVQILPMRDYYLMALVPNF